jgi:dipeptidyl aminopeptidase/acylaminoacyl peptidase
MNASLPKVLPALIPALLPSLFLLAGPAPADALQQPRGMVAEDLYALVTVQSPTISPDGREVVFVRSVVAEDRRSRTAALWTVSTDGTSQPRALTAGPRDRMPRWAPGGERLAFVGSVADEEGTHVFLLPRAGGEPSSALRLRQGSVSDMVWTPDGRLLLTLNLDPAVDDPRQPAPAADPSAPDRTIIRDAVYKAEGEGLLGPERTHLWILDPQVGSLSRLTRGDPRWNDRDAAVSPDGQTVVFRRDGSGDEYEGAFPQDLWTLPLSARPDDAPTPLRLPEGRPTGVRWAPNGRTLLYRFAPGRYARPHVQEVDRAGGVPRTLSLDVDLDPSNMFWHPSGRHLYFTADHRGTHPLYRMTSNGGSVTPLFGEDGAVSSPSQAARDGRITFLYENEVNPPEVWIIDEDGRNPRPLTAFNAELIERLSLTRVEELDILNDAGFLLQGFLVRPIGWEPDTSYPLILNIKGGPGGMWGRRWFPEFQIMSAAGYAVGFVNYRGSSGYGHAFQAAVRRDYGGADARDNLILLEGILDRHRWIDRDRLFITGGSHGGFLTNWITTETTRFRAAVTQRSVSNWISEAGTQSYPPAAMREEFGGTLWENYRLYWERSPLSRADRVRTPTLVLHSDQDVITPLGQGQEWFYALKALGVPTEMVIFHGEGHELSRSGRPINMVARLDHILEWFARWDVDGGSAP